MKIDLRVTVLYLSVWLSSIMCSCIFFPQPSSKKPSSGVEDVPPSGRQSPHVMRLKVFYGTQTGNAKVCSWLSKGILVHRQLG